MHAISSHLLELSDRAFLQARLRSLACPLAEYSFANLYLFRHLHEYRLVEGSGFPLMGRLRKGSLFLMPTSLATEDLVATRELAKRLALPLFPLPQEWLEGFSPLSRITNDPDEADYLFSSQTLATYPGRKLDKKRNLLAQFLKNTSITTHPLNESTASHALAVLQRWQTQADDPPARSDFLPCQEALTLIQALDLTGSVVFVENKPVGFFVGEWNTPTCFSLHFCKGDVAYKGIYSYLFRTVAESAQAVSGTCQINLEQDLGKPALRRAKMAYQPSHLLCKYLAWVDF